MKTSRKLKHRQQWMATFQDEVRKLAPHLAGKINWDAAAFFFNEGWWPDHAAARFVETEVRS